MNSNRFEAEVWEDFGGYVYQFEIETDPDDTVQMFNQSISPPDKAARFGDIWHNHATGEISVYMTDGWRTTGKVQKLNKFP